MIQLNFWDDCDIHTSLSSIISVPLEAIYRTISQCRLNGVYRTMPQNEEILDNPQSPSPPFRATFQSAGSSKLKNPYVGGGVDNQVHLTSCSEANAWWQPYWNPTNADWIWAEPQAWPNNPKLPKKDAYCRWLKSSTRKKHRIWEYSFVYSIV